MLDKGIAYRNLFKITVYTGSARNLWLRAIVAYYA